MTRLRLLFSGAVFLGAFLLFLVEPIAAKQLVPVLGGSAAVWITCLVFFQTALLCAYLYAHSMARRPRWLLYLALLVAGFASAAGWCIRGLGAGAGSALGSAHPILTVFAALATTIGLPFLVLGTTSPLMQVWWARLHGSAIPYRLFALSNLASLLALALYPTLVEPHFTLHTQRIAWCCGFALFALLSGVLALMVRNTATTHSVPASINPPTSLVADEGSPTPTAQKLLWVLLPMGAAMQLSAVTSYLTANIAPIPLLWILPLAVYLLTIILAFEFPRLLPRSIVARFLLVMLAGLGYALSKQDVEWPLRISIAFFLVEAFASCLFCHTEAYRLRPARPSESTMFYLFFAAGGALGSFLIGIVFPLLLRFNLDLVITCDFTALLALLVTRKDGWNSRLLWSVAVIIMGIQIYWINIVSWRNTAVAVRNFYGALSVKQNFGFPDATLRTLTHGNVQHGTQIFGTDTQRRTPTSYYAQDSGVGLAIHFCCPDQANHGATNIGVIGLGAGTIAAYGHPGDRIRFYEINPAVPPIARNVFTYIRDSGAQVAIIGGDARTSLAAEPPQAFDVLVVDAFSGDAIPLHLLTAQALALYRRHLAPGGIIAFHISNRHVDLEPPIALLARTAGMQAVAITTPANDARDEFTATWMLLSDNAEFFAQPEITRVAHSPAQLPGLRLWTDDFSSLLPVLHW